jgi:glucose-1-phosphate adenylyltransferase
MGADFYESPEDKAASRAAGRPDIGIAKGTIVKGAIIDKNARIGENCRIGIDPKPRPDGDFSNYYIVDGIIIIPKYGIIPSGTVI